MTNQWRDGYTYCVQQKEVTKILSPCQPYEGILNRDGYGIVWMGNVQGKKARQSQVKAHRLAYALFYGEDPEGKLVCHTCDNRRCVNPEHLFLGTHRDNSADMVAKGRSARGSGSGNAKLNEDDVRKMRAMFTMGLSVTEISGMFGVDKTTIYRIRKGKSWVACV